MSDSISKITLLKKIREICKTNTTIDLWDSLDVREEFKAIIDLIDEELEWKNTYLMYLVIMFTA